MNKSNQENPISSKNFEFNKRWFTTLATALLLAATTSAAFAEDVEIFKINSKPYGQSYGEWAVGWWQWAFSIPAANNPVTDTTGAFAGVGQQGPVWFLASTFGDSEERTFTVPAGKALFMPVYQWVFGASVNDCEPSVPGVTCDVPTLRASAAAAATSVQTMSVTIDGDTVPKIRQYRAVSPGTFSLTFPEGAVFGFPAGTFTPHVADGYWLMLAPLDSGRHNIRVRVINPSYGTDYTVIYHINVSGREDSNSDRED
jgi:hypothetical protein